MSLSTVEQFLKFADAFCLCRQHQHMLHTRQRGEVAQPVVSLNSVEMMNHPAVCEMPAVSFLPHDKVLVYSAVPRLWMVWSVHQHVTFMIQFLLPRALLPGSCASVPQALVRAVFVFDSPRQDEGLLAPGAREYPERMGSIRVLWRRLPRRVVCSELFMCSVRACRRAESWFTWADRVGAATKRFSAVVTGHLSQMPHAHGIVYHNQVTVPSVGCVKCDCGYTKCG